MSVVRNQTELTQNVTRLVALWLDDKGFKPVETEVYVGDHWVADVAAIGCRTQTELINLRLLKRAPTYPRHWQDGSDADREAHNNAYQAWKATRDAIPSPLSVLVEVKTSAGDYRGDRKWTTSPWPTNLCYVAMPRGMVAKEEWPAGWGVILFSEDGSKIVRTYPSSVQPVTLDRQLNHAMTLAVKRDHLTRYARMREWQKKIRISDGERKTVERFLDAIGVVRRVLKGSTVEEALQYQGVRAKLPTGVLVDLEALRPPVSPKSEEEVA